MTVVPIDRRMPSRPSNAGLIFDDVLASRALNTSSNTRTSLLLYKARAKAFIVLSASSFGLLAVRYTHQALLLPAAEIDAAASNLGVVTVRQAGDILLQGAGAHDRVVPRRIVFISCYDVVADGQVAQPWRLIAVGRR